MQHMGLTSSKEKGYMVSIDESLTSLREDRNQPLEGRKFPKKTTLHRGSALWSCNWARVDLASCCLD